MIHLVNQKQAYLQSLFSLANYTNFYFGQCLLIIKTIVMNIGLIRYLRKQALPVLIVIGENAI